MGSVVEYILDGLEKALELERELGVRAVEIDRGLLADASARLAEDPPREPPHEYMRLPRSDFRTAAPQPPAQPVRTVSGMSEAGHGIRAFEHSNDSDIQDLVFLHDRPLSLKGVEMMAKILNALGKPDASIVVAPPVPQAKITVVLGGLALKKYFAGMRGEPGQWEKTPEGRDVLITYSPEYILRFGTVTPAVQKIKEEMWRSLKAVKQRLAS